MANKPKKARAWEKTRDYRELKEDLENGLKTSGLDTPRYRDLVREYMRSWVQLQELNEDIRERGNWVEYANGTQTGVTENKSLGTKIRLLKAMDDIFRRLGYHDEARMKRGDAARAEAGGDDDEL